MTSRTARRARARALPLVLVPLATLAAAARSAAPPARTAAALSPTFAEPAISPDRSEIAFVSGGDIWTAPAAGGQASLLVAHAASDFRPLYSPDGSRLAFVSTRTGNGDVYILTIATGDLKRLTFDDLSDQLDAWSRDGRWVYFSSTSRDIAGMNDIYRVSSEGGTPMLVSADRYASEYWASPSPTEPGTLAFTARGLTAAQWWRKGHSHIDESEIWLLSGGNPPTYRPVTSGGAKDAWPTWSADGRAIYFVRDRQGVQNVWTVSVTGCPAAGTCDARQVTQFRDGRVLWPTMSHDGRTLVFERNFRIWSLDVATGRASEVPIALRGAGAAAAPERLSLTAQFQGLALSPDGQKVAFVARGEVFAASAKDGGDAARVTTTPANEGQITWAPDSRRIVYASDRGGAWKLFLYDFGARTETQLTHGSESDAAPKFSPDGRSLAFFRAGRELRVLDLAGRRERVLAGGFLDRPPFVSTDALAWSPDGRWIAFQNTEPRQFQNIYVVSTTDGRDPRPVSFLANVFGWSVVWSPDGQFLLFDTSQRTEPGQLARVDLQPRTPRFREDQFRELFRDPTPRPSVPTEPGPARPAPPPAPGDTGRAAEPAVAGRDSAARGARPNRVDVVFDGIRQRLAFLPVGLDVGQVAISPDGKTALLTATAAGQQNLYTYSLDELARETPVARQLTSTAGAKTAAQFSPDGKEVYYLENGRIHAVPVESRQARALNVTAELEVDFAREKEVVFAQAWSILNDNFYDDRFHGVDWRAVRAAYEPFASGARTIDELRRVLSLMVGELNASHLGVGGPSFSPQTVTGRLGLRFDRGEYERAGRLRVSEVIPLGPAALARAIETGDYLLAVDGAPVTARSNLDSLLAHKIGRRVELTVGAAGGGARSRVVVVRPVAATTEKGLLYRDWVEGRRDYVAKASGGRLGYVHMPDMSAQSLTQLFADLDTENYSREGVVIDIRNNNGGFVHAYALDVFARRGFLNMTYRGFTPSPARSVLGQRALDLPTVLITNQHSLSDAEDFTEGYRALGLGQVVGEPTAGWIIYTSNVPLIDGSTLRVPFIRVTDRSGKNMELNPRPVDVAVKRPIGEGYTGRDSQLDAAVRVLLGRITAAR